MIPVTRKQLTSARELREKIYRVVQSALRSKTPAKVDLVALNRQAKHPDLIPQLLKIGQPPAWNSSTPFEAALSMVARDAIDLLSGNQIDQVRECADENCSVLFLDSSRPGRRRWCAMNGCGNKLKKTTYRMKHKSPLPVATSAQNKSKDV